LEAAFVCKRDVASDHKHFESVGDVPVLELDRPSTSRKFAAINE
jgi:hypothetical protein